MKVHTVVIGGGPAGAAAACALAAAGREVVLIEREDGPRHKVCGDFLSGEAQRSLAFLGVSAAALGGAPIGEVRIASGRRTAVSRLPFSGLGLTRWTLDDALLQRAAALGAEVRRGVRVRELIVEDGRFGVRTDEGVLHPQTVLLATGKHGLRGARNESRPSGLVGLKMYYRLAPGQAAALSGGVEIMAFAGGYAGLNAVEHGVADLCLLVSRRRLSDAGGWDGLLEELTAECPRLHERLGAAEPLLDKPLAVSGIAYGYLHPPGSNDLVFRLGDQAAVIGSFSGDGISIALHSGRLAAAVLLAGGDAAEFHRRLHDDLNGQMQRAQVIHRAFGFPIISRLIVEAGRMAPSVLRLGAAVTRISPRAEAALSPC